MNFIPETKQELVIPFYEDAREGDGWKGQATTKSVNRLVDEVTKALIRLGGIVETFQRGTFQTESHQREGYQIHYHVKNPNGAFVSGRLDVAALPVRDKWNEQKKDKSLRMALFIVRDSLSGAWLMQHLSPGYAPLVPWMLADEQRTISQLWAESPAMKPLLPPGDADFIEAEEVA